VLGEVLTPVQLLGALLVLAAAVIVQLRPRGSTRSDEREAVATPV
jgi:drug/metabolite transporter (DMT)-like permease